MISNAKTFFICLFLIVAIVLPKSVFAGQITITAINPLRAQVAVDSGSYPGTYLIKASPYKTIVFGNNFPPSVVQLAQGINPCQLGTHKMSSSGQCVVTLKFTAPSLVGNVNPKIGACYKNTISCAEYKIPLKVVLASTQRLEIRPVGGGNVLNELKLAVDVPLTVELHNVGPNSVDSLTWGFPTGIVGTIVPESDSTCESGSLVSGGSCKLTFTVNSSTKFSPIGEIEIGGTGVSTLKLVIDTFDTLCVGKGEFTPICRVFLSDIHNGNFGGIDAAHTFCNGQAHGGKKNYPTSSNNWKAMLATYGGGSGPGWNSMTVQINAQFKDPTSIKYVNPESPEVGSDPGDTWYISDNLVEDITASNVAGLVGSVWTGSPSTTNNPPTSYDETCQDWTSNSESDVSVPGDLGSSTTNNEWPQGDGDSKSCSSLFPILCVEDEPV